MRHFTICDSLYYAPQVIYPFSAKSAWSRFIGTCLSRLILLLPTSSSCLTALRGVPLHNIVYTCARWPAPPVWLSLYFGHYKVNRSKCDGRPCCDLSQVKPGLPTLLWILCSLCWLQQLVRARSWRVSNQLCCEQPTLWATNSVSNQLCDSGQFLHQWKGSSDAEDGGSCLVVSCFMFTSAEQLYIVTPLSKF